MQFKNLYSDHKSLKRPSKLSIFGGCLFGSLDLALKFLKEILNKDRRPDNIIDITI